MQANGIVVGWPSALLAMTLLSAATCVVALWFASPERRSVAWLTGFIIAVHAGNVPMIIGFAGAYDVWPGLTFLPTDFTPMLGPLLWLHARALMCEDGAGRHVGWLAPGAAYWCYQLWAFTSLGDYRNKWAFNDAWHEPYVVPVVFAVSSVLAIGALVATWRLHRRYAAWLAERRSDDMDFRPVWLVHLVVAVTAFAALLTAQFLLGRFFGYSYFDRYWVDFAAMLVVFVIAVEALVHMQRRYPKMPAEQAAPEPATEADSAREPRDWAAEAVHLREAVERERWYLEPGLSLTAVARRMGSNQTYVSRTLNQGMAQSFSQFVNGLRVAHAQRLIAGSETSLVDVAHEAGFGSKASFNRAFRQHTGMTPSGWRAKGPPAEDVSDPVNR